MRHNSSRAKRCAANEFVGKGSDRALTHGCVVGGEVDQVRGVREHRAEAARFALRDEALGAVLVDGRSIPLPRTLREDLHALAAN